MPILYSNNDIHIAVQQNKAELVLSVRLAATQGRTALEASKAREGTAGLRQDNGAPIVHLAARLDETHATAAVGHATAAPDSLLE